MDLFAWLRVWGVTGGGGGRKEGELFPPFPQSAPSHESSRRESRIPLRVTCYSTWYLIRKNPVSSLEHWINKDTKFWK